MNETGTENISEDETARLCVNTLRFLAIDAVQKANSGHPGMPMGDAAMAYVLWNDFLRHNPDNPRWLGRDRFVLSAGHGSALLYGLLHLNGYNITLNDIKDFRQFGSPTPGHPEYDIDRGIETTTGPLGQGFATGVGMAMSQRFLADRYNRPGFDLFDYNVYAITSDGDLMEGVAGEAASLAGHLKLGKLVYLYSDNRITIEGSTDLSFTEDVGKRFEAMDWHVLSVEDGNDLCAIKKAIEAAKGETERPSIILVRTNIGFGSPNKQDTAGVHGSPLGADEVELTRQELCWLAGNNDDNGTFCVPDAAKKHFAQAETRGREIQSAWNEMFARYEKEFPELAKEVRGLCGKKKECSDTESEACNAWKDALPSFKAEDGPIATRSASGKVLNSIAESLPLLVGGSADLAPSNNTELKGFDFFTEKASGRNVHYGVREHAMGAVMNGMALSGLVPFGGTFLVFSDYMRGAIRIAALSKLNVVYVFTHDSIGLGEDGPTHQPIEHLAGLRSIPNLTVLRPADARETVCAWRTALSGKTDGPVAMVLTRQKVPVIDKEKYSTADPCSVGRGAYIVADASDNDGEMPDLIIIATGSEVHLALEARDVLISDGVKTRVVSMPSFELFDAQDSEYREKILPQAVTARISVEAASPQGWHKYVGSDGDVIGISSFGASAPHDVLFEKFGFTVDNIVERAKVVLSKKARA